MFCSSSVTCRCTFVDRIQGRQLGRGPGLVLAKGNSCSRSLQPQHGHLLADPRCFQQEDKGHFRAVGFDILLCFALLPVWWTLQIVSFSFKLIFHKGSQSGFEKNEKWRSHFSHSFFLVYSHFRVFLNRDCQIWEGVEFKGIYFHFLLSIEESVRKDFSFSRRYRKLT